MSASPALKTTAPSSYSWQQAMGYRAAKSSSSSFGKAASTTGVGGVGGGAVIVMGNLARVGCATPMIASRGRQDSAARVLRGESLCEAAVRAATKDPASLTPGRLHSSVGRSDQRWPVLEGPTLVVRIVRVGFVVDL